MPENDDRYELVMPFVVVASAGGPYDDDAFLAGCRFAEVVSALRARPMIHESYTYRPLVDQLDLLAMHEGYRLTYQPWDADPEEWVRVRFVRATWREATDGFLYPGPEMA